MLTLPFRKFNNTPNKSSIQGLEKKNYTKQEKRVVLRARRNDSSIQLG